jgi:hypothetical protein
VFDWTFRILTWENVKLHPSASQISGDPVADPIFGPRLTPEFNPELLTCLEPDSILLSMISSEGRCGVKNLFQDSWLWGSMSFMSGIVAVLVLGVYLLSGIQLLMVVGNVFLGLTFACMLPNIFNLSGAEE